MIELLLNTKNVMIYQSEQLVTSLINQNDNLEYMGGIFVDPYQQDKYIDTTNPQVMALLVKSLGLNSGIANIDHNFD